MKRFKNFLPLIETSLNKAALQDPVGQGPNSGKPRIEIFANKIKNGEEHILDDGSTIKITKITMSYGDVSNEVYGIKDMNKLI